MSDGPESVLAVLVYFLSHGYSPSVREIAEFLGLHSSSTVHRHLATLEREKKIVRDGARRLIRLREAS
jgi:repressor LexA